MIKLTSHGIPGYIKKDSIIMILPEGEGSDLHLSTGIKLFVEQSPEEVLKLIKPAPKKKGD